MPSEFVFDNKKENCDNNLRIGKYEGCCPEQANGAGNTKQLHNINSLI